MAFLRPTTPNHCPNSHDEISAFFRRRLFNIDHPEAIPHRQGGIGHYKDRAPNCELSDFGNQLILMKSAIGVYRPQLVHSARVRTKKPVASVGERQ